MKLDPDRIEERSSPGTGSAGDDAPPEPISTRNPEARMLTTTRIRRGSPALLALGLLSLLPASAEAQLFPNQPIRRQRESCATEPPFYSQVRREYYGYFPTCWSKFPEGWACPCPNPELPDPAKSFRDNPRSEPTKPDDADRETGMDPTEDGMPGEPPGPDANIPPLPNTRAPFNMDESPVTPPQPDAPGTATPPSRAPNSNAPARPGDNPSVPPASRSTPPTTLREMPGLPDLAPSMTRRESPMEPGSMVMVPDATLTSNPPSSRPDLGPIPSAPLPNPGMMAEPEPMVGRPPAAPAQAPQRRGLLGGLFGSGNRRRR